MTTISYTGRKSGKSYSLPLGYWRNGDVITVRSNYGSERKSWWRNFTGEGAPLTIWLDGAEQPGHAVATRDSRGRVKVTIRLCGA